MTSDPFISVIMPVYNRAALLDRVAGSILSQSYRNFELLIVDDASSDDIEAAVAALGDERVRLVRRAENGGVGAARNSGVEAARGDYVAFHDSDDYCTFDRLALSVAAMAALPEDYIGVYGVRLIYNEVTEANYTQGHVTMIPRAGTVPLSGDIAARTKIGNIINFPTLMVKRSALLAAGPSDPLLRKNVDWDLCLRLTEQGKIGFVPEPLILTPTSLDPNVSGARVSRSMRQGARSYIRITGKLRRTGVRGAALAKHYASAGRALMRIDRPALARRFFAASLAEAPKPRVYALYAVTYVPRLHAMLRGKERL